MAAGVHFGCPKFTFDRISGYFRSICNFLFLEIFDIMAAVGHFGCPKFTFDYISDHFRSIHNFIFFGHVWPNGYRRPFWMSEIHFRSHFWPFYINTEFLFLLQYFLQNGRWRTFGMFENHIWLHFWPFQIDRPFWMSNSLSIAILAISDRYRIFCWKPFWMSENHFRSHSAHFRSIGHFGCPKFTFNGISGHFRSLRILILFFIFDKMAVGGHFGCAKITFEHISGEFRPIRNFFRPRYLDE